jgi:hypothetical protein
LGRYACVLLQSAGIIASGRSEAQSRHDARSAALSAFLARADRARSRTALAGQDSSCSPSF